MFDDFSFNNHLNEGNFFFLIIHRVSESAASLGPSTFRSIWHTQPSAKLGQPDMSKRVEKKVPHSSGRDLPS